LEVSGLYKSADAFHKQGTHIVSIDEKTGMQALEPNAPIEPCKPGQVERREFEYTRHGTQVLTEIRDFKKIVMCYQQVTCCKIAILALHI
jgi:hypothetical protein